MVHSNAGRRILAGGVAIGGAAALAGAAALPSAVAAPATGSSWHVVQQVVGSANGGFTAVTSAPRNVIWAFEAGKTPTAWRRASASRWKQFPVPGPVTSASATSDSNAWAITRSGKVLRWTGAAWVISTVIKGGSQIQALGPSDVWVFGSAWEHYNGATWSRVTSAPGPVSTVSVLSDTSIWTFGQSSVVHWNGHAFARTSVKKLLVRKTASNNPGLVGIYAQSRNNIWAIGNGDTADAGGPLFILHDNGHGWSRVAVGALGSYGGSAVAPDGRGGLWIPLNGASGGPTTMAHFAHGKLSTVKLPVPASQITFLSVAPVPGSIQAIAGGFTHNASFTKFTDVVLEYRP